MRVKVGHVCDTVLNIAQNSNLILVVSSFLPYFWKAFSIYVSVKTRGLSHYYTSVWSVTHSPASCDFWFHNTISTAFKSVIISGY